MYIKVLYNNNKNKKNVWGEGEGQYLNPKTLSMYLKKKKKKKSKKKKIY